MTLQEYSERLEALLSRYPHVSMDDPEVRKGIELAQERLIIKLLSENMDIIDET